MEDYLSWVVACVYCGLIGPELLFFMIPVSRAWLGPSFFLHSRLSLPDSDSSYLIGSYLASLRECHVSALKLLVSINKYFPSSQDYTYSLTFLC